MTSTLAYGTDRIPVAQLPAVQRDLYLSRCLRRENDTPSGVGTMEVVWRDMVVAFASDEAVTAATVEVRPGISIVTFTSRLESLLDCGAAAAKEWTVKWSAPISDYGSPEEVRRLLCDKIAQLDPDTGETVGVLKLKRRSVTAGHAKLRLAPLEDSLQVVIRHTSAQGVKALWKSALWRLRPQHGEQNAAVRAVVVTPPCIRVEADKNNWSYYADQLSRLGVVIDPRRADAKGVRADLPLDAAGLANFGNDRGSHFYGDNVPRSYYAAVRVGTIPPGGLPEGVEFGSRSGLLVVQDKHYGKFLEKFQALSNWLGLGWRLPEAS